MKKKIALLVLLPLLLIGCGGGGSSNSGGNSSGGGESGGGTDPIPEVKKSAKEVFCDAKKSTFESTTYEYTYDVTAKIKVKSAVNYSPANIKGTVQYNKNGKTTQYMSKRELSGLLLIDSTSYTYNVGNDLVKVNADESKDFSVIDHQTIDSGYDFETNSVGLLLKVLDNNDNLTVTKDTSGKYNIGLKTNFAQDSFLKVLNYIDSTKIIKILNKVTQSKWGVGFGVNCYATLDSAESKVKTFHFDVNVDVKDTVSVTFSLDQTFTSYSGDINIKLPEFANTYVTSNEIDSQLSSLRTAFDKNKMSYYKYDLKTAVDHGMSLDNPLGLAVNSHSQGYAERAELNNEIFFHNGLELDSDYKNKDQYPEICDDYKFTRANLNNATKDVYDVHDGVLKNTYNLIENYNNHEIDDYYMLINKDWISSNTVKIMRKTTDAGETSYKLGLGADGIKSILAFYNKQIRLSSDPTKEHIDVFKINGNFDAKKADFSIVTNTDGDITSIDIVLKGFYDMAADDDVKFELKLKIRFDYTKKAYEIPTDKKDITLPNYDVIG